MNALCFCCCPNRLSLPIFDVRNWKNHYKNNEVVMELSA